jgi:phage terminase large subunit GpA-like protein
VTAIPAVKELSIFEKRAVEVFDIGFFEGLRPDPILSVSEWADEHRILSSVGSSEPGKWRTSRTPFLREIMDCLSSMSPVQKVVFVKGAQVGGTEVGNNWMAYVIDRAPGPMMSVQPTLETVKRNSRTRIKSLIEDCPRLKEKIRPTKSRDGGNSMLQKEFPGGVLVLSGANSAVSLRSMPVRFLMLDEVDGYPDDVDGEGDPIVLAEARTRTFSMRKKIYLVSTPTFEGRSKIQNAYEETDKRRYHVPCPHCKELQWLKWGQMKWPDGKPDEAYYVCEHCKDPIQEHNKTWMLESGRWVAENPGFASGKIVGFHLSALYTPLGLGDTWGDYARQFLKAQGNPAELRGFINTVLGETWREKGDAPEWQRIHDRREDYEIGTLDSKVVFLTAGVDIQKDRIECEVVGWGRDKQSWSIEYRVFEGDTASDVPWLELEKILEKVWKHPNGPEMKIRKMAVDTGFNTQHVYNWVRKFPIDRVMAVKGLGSAALLLGQPTAVDVKTNGRKVKRGLKLWSVGVGIAKGELYSWLKMEKPLDNETFPRGYCHFPQYGDEYFKQLTAEQLVVRIVKGLRRYEWEKVRDRNEALDCRVYARAAAALVGLDRLTDEQWNEMITRPKNNQQREPEKSGDKQQQPELPPRSVFNEDPGSRRGWFRRD